MLKSSLIFSPMISHSQKSSETTYFYLIRYKYIACHYCGNNVFITLIDKGTAACSSCWFQINMLPVSIADPEVLPLTDSTLEYLDENTGFSGESLL